MNNTVYNTETNFYTGKPNVRNLGYVFLMRNYRSDLSKWQTEDPLGYPDGWNNFAYCNNQSTMGIDLYGCSILDPLFYDIEYFTTEIKIDITETDKLLRATFICGGGSKEEIITIASSQTISFSVNVNTAVGLSIEGSYSFSEARKFKFENEAHCESKDDQHEQTGSGYYPIWGEFEVTYAKYISKISPTQYHYECLESRLISLYAGKFIWTKECVLKEE